MSAQILVEKAKDKYQIPKLGTRIPVEKFHISETNVNFDEPFGESEEDIQLIENLKAGKKIVQPFKARPEGEGYGVYLGRRRFLAKKAVGVQFFVVGKDCLIDEISEEEAEEASWIENFKGFRKGMNPIIRAKGLEKLVERFGLREFSRRSGIPASTLSEYLSVLKLSPKMQDLLAKGVIKFKDGVMIARKQLDERQQEKLAVILKFGGLKAFYKELVSIRNKKFKKKQTKKRKKRKHTKTKKSETTQHDEDAESKSDEMLEPQTHVNFDRQFWKELTQPLKEFFQYWNEYSILKEWQDDRAYHLVLEVTMPKDLKQESSEIHDSETAMNADEIVGTCHACGKKIFQGQRFKKVRGFFICGDCADKEHGS